MGCWGITASESDAGLDALAAIRTQIQKDGTLKLEDILAELKRDAWNAPVDVHRCESHTSPMMLADVIVRFLDECAAELDFGEIYQKDKRFSRFSSFTGEKATIQWLRDYLSDTLKYSCERAENTPRCGWFKEQDWIGWQEHMEHLILRMDMLLASDLEKGELTELQVSGEINYQKEAERISEQEGHVWKGTNADCENETGDLECERCHKFQVLHW